MKNRYYRWSLGFIFTLICVFSQVQVHAQSSSPSNVSIERLLSALNIAVAKEEFIDHFKIGFKDEINSMLPNMNPAQEKIADQMARDISLLFATHIDFSKVVKNSFEAAKLIFTQKEVDLLLQFFDSPEGLQFTQRAAVGRTTAEDDDALVKFIASSSLDSSLLEKIAELNAIVEAEVYQNLGATENELEAIFVKGMQDIQAAE